MLCLEFLVALSPEIRTRLETLGSDVACMSHIVRGVVSNRVDMVTALMPLEGFSYDQRGRRSICIALESVYNI